MIQSVHCIAPGFPGVQEKIVPPSNGWRIATKVLTSTSTSGTRSLRTRRNSGKSHISIGRPRATLTVDKEFPLENNVADQSIDQGRPHVGDVDGNLPSANLSQTPDQDIVGFWKSLSDFLNEEDGPPRWFCPVPKTTQTPSHAPSLLFLPGIVGASMGLFFHQEALGRLFQLRSLHIPLMDRTPFEGLVSIVEEAVRNEVKSSPGSPIYLVGDDFGGALALAVAAQNPHLDLVLILLNPATSIDSSALQQILPVLQALPSQMFNAAPILLGFLTSNSDQFLSSRFTSTLPMIGSLEDLSEILGSLVSSIPRITQSVSKDTVLWKLGLLKSSALIANSRIDGVKAEVLVLVSNKDQFLPSLLEAKKLSKLLPNCSYRQFTESSHSLLLDEDFDLASVIKSTGRYRQTWRKDIVDDFVFPTEEEINKFYESTRLLRRLCSPVFFSTSEDGEVAEGLSMLPTKGPIIFVGNHALLGLDLKIVASEILKSRQMAFRGLAHPMLFMDKYLEEYPGIVEGDLGRLFGAVPVSSKNMFKLLARGDSVGLYPGGAREALHRKGEENKLFWPDQAEFVKMAAKFGATIIPFCTLGGDEVLQVLADINDYENVPIVGSWIVDYFKQLPRLRTEAKGEVANQILHMPIVAPKLSGPGRLYTLFGQPFYTEGKREYFKDQKNVNATYQQVKEAVEDGILYLRRKREEDPYRHFLPRTIYELFSGSESQAPTFRT